MPYLEILAPSAPEPRIRTASQALTRGVVEAFRVPPTAVTLYFLPVAAHHCAHGGRMGDEGATAGAAGEPREGARVFVKVHAYRRSPAQRRALAAAITPALAVCFATPPRHVAVYFLDRERDEVAHDGHLASDEEAAAPPAPAA